VDKDVITEKDKITLMAESWGIFKDAIKKHSDRLQQEDPVEKFKDILSTLIAQGKVRLNGKNNVDSIMGSGMGELIGYHDEEFLYLIPSAIWKSVQVFCRDSNTHFPVSKNTLYQMLRNRGLIEVQGTENVVNVWMGTKTKRVLKLLVLMDFVVFEKMRYNCLKTLQGVQPICLNENVPKLKQPLQAPSSGLPCR
jgi:hypothetical protein